ncbi:type VI secretion system Vgr family protein [Massilia sp. Root351]|jgi:Rhs element Vgr protein|uniref:type VI secretion system Vgr family protein n=1 Tax=Massilia sp. Root351 TaxID=1736522 RepID=UPI0009E6C09C|nr:type VI secretion system tip protein TssI/VgrG [Massilia sp. Root351]
MPAPDFTQASRLLQLATPLGADVLLAERVRAEEALGEGFRVRIDALSTDAGLGLRALIGQPAVLQVLSQEAGAPRAFHGHITAAELGGADGGFARYALTLEPWTAFLAHGRDSRVFQDATVFDILDAVFARWHGQGKLAPAWRFDIQDRAQYPRRSLVTQYQESDFAFAERLMSEEGLFYYYEHSADPASPSLGMHTLVVADHNGSFQPNPCGEVRFTQPGAVMKQDSMDRWRTEFRLGTNAVELLSWDYRALDVRSVSAASADPAGDGAPLASRDAPGLYAYVSREHGQRIAQRQLEALEAQQEVHVGAGTVRTLLPGTTFTLSGEATLDAAGGDARTMLVVRAVHLMHNNLAADLRASVARALPASPLQALLDGELGAVLHSAAVSAVGAAAAGRSAGDANGAGAAVGASGRAAGLLDSTASAHAAGDSIAERPLYRNRIEAIRAAVPYRSRRDDGQGQLLRPRPAVRGQQTALVVGPPGAPVYTDRDHRIKVQFHWQRGDASHSRLAHPDPASHAGAPADDQAGTWVRVATPLAPVAGANWGSNAVPRVGQEVLVDFIEGDIDRPVVIGVLYNGKGAADAQSNQVAQGGGSATGNAAAWFPGEAAGHAHPAVLSGIKSQALQASQRGDGSYRQLVFDDSPGQPRVALQHHASPHTGTAELNLGHLRHQTDNQRLVPAGFGAELKAEHATALRAGAGMLLSADARAGGIGAHMDAREAQTQLDSAAQLQTQLADTAQQHNAGLPDANGAKPAPAELPAIKQTTQTAAALCAVAGGSAMGGGSEGGEGGLGDATAYSQPLLQLSSPAGIAALTPASAIVTAAAHSAITAGQDIDQAAQGNLLHQVKSGITLFTYGKAGNADKPNQETGIRLHAASGKFSSQSQSGPTRATADKTITVASTAGSVTAAARQHVLLTAQGAYIRLEGGNIDVHGPGTMSFKAAMKDLTGPSSASPELPALPHPDNIGNDIELRFQYDDLDGVPGAPFLVTFANGTVRKGKLDDKGHAQLKNVPPGDYTVEFGEDPRDWEAPPLPEPEHRKAEVREQGRLAVEQARAEYERGQA